MRGVAVNGWFTLEERYAEAHREKIGMNAKEAEALRGITAERLHLLEQSYRSRVLPIFDLCINRNLMATARYNLEDALTIPAKYSTMANMQVKLDAYKKDGNKEDLIDLMNYIILEFINEQHPKAHWCAQDDSAHAI